MTTINKLTHLIEYNLPGTISLFISIGTYFIYKKGKIIQQEEIYRSTLYLHPGIQLFYLGHNRTGK